MPDVRDRLAEIKADIPEVNDYPPGAVPSDFWDFCRIRDMLALVAALEAVLDEHEPVGGMSSPTCKRCASWLEDAAEGCPWPCPTVREITKALEGER